ncbi:Planctomycete extracellular domain protein [Aporhodopirellula aestuarii]|uniref:Planctomycete extracellular domain protein n=1 Tax=Aporhodopirellula aestuarii TaxID=2950107 RepID=A0ABT0UB29_9BACT|nr:Planctomycete extracellular domain protein [Aporhodopirellula aestuarii]MCM2374217.1 Planctomycete extracellular domain protein [Aporhodopirellula aestuarii]
MKLFKRQRREPASTRSKPTRRRRMRVETLENRRVLAANFVTVDITGDTVMLSGDTNANEIEIWQDSRRAFSPSESFTIKAAENSETMFVDSAGLVIGDTFQSPVNVAIHNINIDFGQGGADSVEFVGLDQSDTDASTLDGMLTIITNGEAEVSLSDLEVETLLVSHQDDDDIGTTTLTDVVVSGDDVSMAGTRNFFSTHIESGGGGSVITILDSNLKGGLSISNDGLVDFSGPIVHMMNPTGAADVIKITNTDIGELLVLDPQNVLEIYNGDGGSRTTLERDNATDPSRIRGNVVITNEAGFDEVSFSGINIWGSSDIENGAGDFLHGSSIMIFNESIIGSDLLEGGRLNVVNGDGDDRLTIEESRLPSGIIVNNGNDHDTNTIIIGKAGDVALPAERTIIGGNTLAGSVIQFANGDGNERLSIINTDLRGLVDIGLSGGDDSVNMSDVIVDGALNIGNTENIRPAFVDDLFTDLGIAGADDGDDGLGNDRVTLEDVMVTAGTFIDLGDDQDRVDLIDTIDFGPRAIINGGDDSGDTLDRSELSSVMTNVALDGFRNHIN